MLPRFSHFKGGRSQPKVGNSQPKVVKQVFRLATRFSEVRDCVWATRKTPYTTAICAQSGPWPLRHATRYRRPGKPERGLAQPVTKQESTHVWDFTNARYYQQKLPMLLSEHFGAVVVMMQGTYTRAPTPWLASGCPIAHYPNRLYLRRQLLSRGKG